MALVALAIAACATERVPLPAGSALEPLAALPAQAPDDFDLGTRTLAAAVLLGDPERAGVAAERIDALDAERRAAELPPSGLAPYAQDARNATIYDPLAFRAAQRELLDRDDLEPALERRVRTEVDDDPLALADQRLFEARRSRVTRLWRASNRRWSASASGSSSTSVRTRRSSAGSRSSRSSSSRWAARKASAPSRVALRASCA